jgi:hypothetical protein
VGRREHEPKAQVDKVDTGDSQDKIAGDHDTAANNTIDEIHQSDLLIRPLLNGSITHLIASLVAASASPVKL